MIRSLCSLVPRRVKVSIFPDGACLLRAHLFLAHGMDSCSGEISKSSTIKELGMVLSLSSHSGLRKPLSGCPANPPMFHVLPSIRIEPSVPTALSIFSPVILFIISMVARLGMILNTLETMLLAIMIFLLSAVRYMLVSDLSALISQSNPGFSMGSSTTGSCAIFCSSFLFTCGSITGSSPAKLLDTVTGTISL